MIINTYKVQSLSGKLHNASTVSKWDTLLPDAMKILSAETLARNNTTVWAAILNPQMIFAGCAYNRQNITTQEHTLSLLTV